MIIVVIHFTVSATVDALAPFEATLWLLASYVTFVIVQIDCRSVSLLVAEQMTLLEIEKSSLYAQSLGLISPHGISIVN